MNILEYYEAQAEKQLALIFLDAEKVFDNVSLSFIMEPLKAIEAGEKFSQMIQAVCAQQTHRRFMWPQSPT